MRLAARWTVIALPLGVLGAVSMAVHCTNGDNPLPSIPPNGSLKVSPCAYPFPVTIPGDGQAPPSKTFELHGTIPGGLGADSVPVHVMLGVCNPDGGRAVAAVSYGATPPNTMSLSGSCSGEANPALAPPSQWAHLQLTGSPDAGCAVISTDELACTLSADGIASFAVVATLPMTSTEGKAIPICVATQPLSDTVWLPIFIASALDGGMPLALSAPNEGGIPATITPDQPCSSLFDCTSNRQIAVTMSLPEVAQQPIALSVALSPAQKGVWFSPIDCTHQVEPPPGQAPPLVTFPAGASQALLGYVCVDDNDPTLTYPAAPPDGAPSPAATLTVTSPYDPTVQGAVQSIQIDPQPQDLKLVATSTDAGTVYVPSALGCGGQALGAQLVTNIVGVSGTTTSPYDGGVQILSVPEGGATLEVFLGGASTCTIVGGGL